MAFAWSLCLKATCCFLLSYLKTNLKLALQKLHPFQTAKSIYHSFSVTRRLKMQNLQHSNLFVYEVQRSADAYFWEYMKSMLIKSVDVVKENIIYIHVK